MLAYSVKLFSILVKWSNTFSQFYNTSSGQIFLKQFLLGINVRECNQKDEILFCKFVQFLKSKFFCKKKKKMHVILQVKNVHF